MSAHRGDQPSAAGSWLSRLRASELGRLFGDSVYSGLWQAATVVADLVQIVLITHALGLTAYGELAVAIAFVVLVGQFFDLRVGVATTVAASKHVGRDSRRLAGVLQLSYLVDAATGVVGFAVVALLAPLVGGSLVGDGGTTLILLYAIILLVGTVDESSFTTLRLLDRFRLIAAYTIATEALRIALVALALVVFGTITSVALALVVHRAIAATMSGVAAVVVFRRATGGVRLTQGALQYAREDRPAMLRTMLHTNVVSYARLAQVQLPTVALGAITGAAEAGIYKVGMAAATLVGKLADPTYIALLPRMSRLWAAGEKRELKSLIERLSAVFIPVTLVAAGALIVFSGPVLDLLGGENAAREGKAVVVFGALAQVVNAGLLWNIAMLYAAGRSRTVSFLAVAAALVQVAALLPLAEAWGASGAACALFISMLVLNVPATFAALSTVRGRAKASAITASRGIN